VRDKKPKETMESKIETNERIAVLKTYKLYINGQFPRTESGRYNTIFDKNGKPSANACLASRKDFRNAVVAARAACKGWPSRSAFNRSQILYRIAEMMESRKWQLIEEENAAGFDGEKEVLAAIDTMVYYAGCCDKYQQIFSTVNPVASSHFNFSVPEPMGVVAAIAPPTMGILAFVSLIAPIIAGGNTCVALANENQPLSAITFGEILHSSDLPNGVVNILSAKIAELLPTIASYMDVNAVVYAGDDNNYLALLKEKGADNMKRIIHYDTQTILKNTAGNPYCIMDTVEIKTTWHPIENIASAGAGY